MKDFEIVADTSNDLRDEYLKENNIKTVSFYLTLDGENYLQDQVDITRQELYIKLRENKNLFPKTSLPSVDDYYKKFKPLADEGKDIICFTVSSSLSGSYQSANIAANFIMEENKDRKIYLIDSRAASLGVGILIEKAVKFRKQGLDIEEVVEKIRPITDTTEIYIALDTLTYLEKGGRIGKTSAVAGNLLKLKPVVSLVDNQLALSGTVRGSKKAIEKALELLDKKIGKDPNNYEIFIVHGDNEIEANKVKTKIEEKYSIKINSEVSLVSATIISHVGPGAIAIGAMRKL